MRVRASARAPAIAVRDRDAERQGHPAVTRGLRAPAGPGSNRGQGLRHALAPLALVLLAYAALLLSADPRGGFPLNDDWSYAATARRLAEGGGFRPGSWTSFPLFTQALWGAAFVRLFGFSFEILRLSTVALGAAALLSAWWLARHLGASGWSAAVLAACLAVNPIFFSLSLTFMSDVPFLAACLVALALLAASVEADGRPGVLLGGAAASVAATLVRQPGLAAPCAFLLAHGAGRCSRRRLVEALVPLAASALALVSFERWLSAGGLPTAYRAGSILLRDGLAQAPLALAVQLVERVVSIGLYSGLFLLPLLLLAVPPLWLHAAWRARSLAGAAALVAWLFACVASLGGFPFESGVYRGFGVGPLTIAGAGPPDTQAPLGFRQLLSVLATAGFTMLTLALGLVFADGLKRPLASQRPRILLVSAAAVYVVPFLLSSALFDRYWLPVIALAGILCASEGTSDRAPARGARRVVAVMLLSGWGALSTAATHDSFEWNRARWRALRMLLAQGIPATSIEGGFEFNGWMGRDGTALPLARAKAEWTVAFRPLPGYGVAGVCAYRRWLPPGEAAVYVLRRAPEPHGPGGGRSLDALSTLSGADGCRLPPEM